MYEHESFAVLDVDYYDRLATLHIDERRGKRWSNLCVADQMIAYMHVRYIGHSRSVNANNPATQHSTSYSLQRLFVQQSTCLPRPEHKKGRLRTQRARRICGA